MNERNILAERGVEHVFTAVDGNPLLDAVLEAQHDFVRLGALFQASFGQCRHPKSYTTDTMEQAKAYAQGFRRQTSESRTPAGQCFRKLMSAGIDQIGSPPAIEVVLIGAG